MGYRTALVTGASSGIGRGLARRLARDGAHVVVCARRTRELAAVADEIAQAGGRARILPLDVTDTTRTVEAIRALDEEIGGLELIIANAGIGGPRPAAKMTWESIEPMLRVNFDGAIATLTAVLPRMLARGHGHLVAVSSLAALTPLPAGAPYCATKAGLSAFLASLRLELSGMGIHVTTVQPGVVKTPMSDRSKRPLPFMVSCDKAVNLIVDRLPAAPTTIDFPFPMAAALRLLASLPRPLRDAALRRLPIPEEEGA